MFKAHRLMNNPRVRAKTATPFRDNGFRNILHPFWLKSAVLAWSSHRHCKLYVAIKSCNPPSCDCSVLIILMETLRNKLSGAVHRRHLRRALYCIVLLSSKWRSALRQGAAVLSPAGFSSTGPLLPVAVGIDLRLAFKLGFPYSFSEVIEQNEISRQLSPPGTHKLMNFQNLFGFVVRP